MKNKSFRLLVLAFAGIMILASVHSRGQDTTRYSVKMAESIMKWKPAGWDRWNYVTGTVLRGFEELWRVTGDQRYFDYIQLTVDRAVSPEGVIIPYDKEDYNIDQIKEGCQLLLLIKETGEEKYRIAADLLREQLEEHPRTTTGGFWHKKRYPWQMWLDGLYMGSPFLAEYGELFDRPEDLDDVVLQITQMDIHAYDSITGLYYHGWDESGLQSWGDPETGCSQSFWGRAIGWYAMAIVDVLDHLPMDHDGRDTIVGILNRLAEGVARYQDPDSKVWWQVTDQIARDSNYLESSSSCMFVYALAKGVRLGYLDEKFSEVAISGYQGILDQFIEHQPDGTINLTKTCRTAGLGNGRDGTYAYYTMETDVVTNDGKALGPFITASIEIEMLDSLYPPGNLRADTLLFEGPVLNWFNNSPPATEFQLERSYPDQEPGVFTTIATLSGDRISYTDTSVVSGVLCTYRIRAINDTIISGYSNIVTLTALYKNGQPLPAGNPIPEDGTEMIPYDQVLSWDSGSFATSHDLYFGLENPPPYVGNLPDNSWSPDVLEKGETYYWKIDEVNEYGTTTGTIWSFTVDTTAAVGIADRAIHTEPIPMIYPNPASHLVQVRLKPGLAEGILSFYDNSGKQVLQYLITSEMADPEGFQALEIDISSFPSGVYYLAYREENSPVPEFGSSLTRLLVTR